MKKKDYILLRLIEEYIKHPEPISSKKLQSLLDIDISSATIRYYFKQLTEAGRLEKSHISSGRIPTQEALNHFWKERLQKELFIPLDEEIDVDALAKDQGIFCEYFTMVNKPLTGVEHYKDFLVILFEDREVLVSYNKNLKRFLENQIGRSSFELAKLCQDIGLISFSKILKKFLQQEFRVCAIEEIVEIANEDIDWAKKNLQDLLNGTKLYERRSGIGFDDQILSYKFQIAKSNRPGEMLLLGRVHRDFAGFINTLQRS